VNGGPDVGGRPRKAAGALDFDMGEIAAEGTAQANADAGTADVTTKADRKAAGRRPCRKGGECCQHSVKKKIRF
jgi:hypothetical protein